jgi:hypothetical protein
MKELVATNRVESLVDALLDPLGIGLAGLKAEQPIMVRRPVAWRQA